MSAQFVSLSRCQAAYPCAIPFGLEYRPDPLIAGQYAHAGNTGVSVRVSPGAPMTPKLDRRRQVDLSAVNEAVRKWLELHPPPGMRNRRTPAGEGAGR